MAASKVDAHMKRMDVEYISVREIHRLHIPLGLEGCHAFTTKHFSEQEPDRAKRIPKVSLFPLAFQRDTVTNTDVSSTREGGWISMFPLLDWVLFSQKLLEAEM